MISLEEVEAMIKAELNDAQVTVKDLTGGGDHLEAIVVSSGFKEKTRVQQHQMVYRALKELMDSEVIHALALKTYTPQEWQKVQQTA